MPLSLCRCRAFFRFGVVLLVVMPCWPPGAVAKDDIALRRKCANMVKVKLGIKETGSSEDLRGVRGAVQMVDRCVANGGRL